MSGQGTDGKSLPGPQSHAYQSIWNPHWSSRSGPTPTSASSLVLFRLMLSYCFEHALRGSRIFALLNPNIPKLARMRFFVWNSVREVAA